MANPDQGWPLHHLEKIKTLSSLDGKHCVHFAKGANDAVQFFAEELREDIDQGQRYSTWVPQPLSGLYPDLKSAEADAMRKYPWLVSQIK
jgi:hypothetical protein